MYFVYFQCTSRFLLDFSIFELFLGEFFDLSSASDYSRARYEAILSFFIVSAKFKFFSVFSYFAARASSAPKTALL